MMNYAWAQSHHLGYTQQDRDPWGIHPGGFYSPAWTSYKMDWVPLEAVVIRPAGANKGEK